LPERSPHWSPLAVRPVTVVGCVLGIDMPPRRSRPTSCGSGRWWSLGRWPGWSARQPGSPGARTPHCPVVAARSSEGVSGRATLTRCDTGDRGRTVPFGLFCHSLLIIWYALHGYDPTDATQRRTAVPWYGSDPRSNHHPGHAYQAPTTDHHRPIYATLTRPATTQEILQVQQAWALAAA